MKIMLSGGDFGGTEYETDQQLDVGTEFQVENCLYRYDGPGAVFIGYAAQ